MNDVPQSYLDAVKAEWNLWAPHVSRRYELRSVYIGGGTPSLLNGAQACSILASLVSVLPVSQDCEITLEGNPDSLDFTTVCQYAEAGVNRISIGVQSFSDTALAVLGRLHTANEADRAVNAVRQAGIRNVSIDLMYGLPGSSEDDELRSLRHGIALAPEHISWYNLTVAPGTPLASMVAAGSMTMPDDDKVLDIMRRGWQCLASAGYRHYEVSNFCLRGYASIHNVGYWTYKEYIGLGVGASGFLEGRRWTNVGDWKAYRDRLERHVFPVGSEERLSKRAREGEYVMLRMRMPCVGLSYADFRDMFGENVHQVFGDALNRLADDGLITMQPDRAVCTQRGLELNNIVAEAFIE